MWRHAHPVDEDHSAKAVEITRRDRAHRGRYRQWVGRDEDAVDVVRHAAWVPVDAISMELAQWSETDQRVNGARTIECSGEDIAAAQGAEDGPGRTFSAERLCKARMLERIAGVIRRELHRPGCNKQV